MFIAITYTISAWIRNSGGWKSSA